jgi:hypothetical protein
MAMLKNLKGWVINGKPQTQTNRGTNNFGVFCVKIHKVKSQPNIS